MMELRCCPSALLAVVVMIVYCGVPVQSNRDRSPYPAGALDNNYNDRGNSYGSYPAGSVYGQGSGASSGRYPSGSVYGDRDNNNNNHGSYASGSASSGSFPYGNSYSPNHQAPSRYPAGSVYNNPDNNNYNRDRDRARHDASVAVNAAAAAVAGRRYKRQLYDSDQIDPVTGAQLAECTFYGDQTVDCSGRLRCHPSDVPDRATLAVLDRECAREPSQKSGTWDRDQVIPANMMRNAGNGRVAKCVFYANHGSGQFVCTGIQGDNWKGKYTGTMNTAFKLGLPLTSRSGLSSGGYPVGGTATLGREPAYSRPSTYGNDNDYVPYGTATTRRYPSSSIDRDNYGNGGYSTGLGYDSGLGGRDTPYGSRDRDNGAISSRYPSSDVGSDRYGSSSPRVSENQITMCTYANDGTGKCRDCSERVTVDEDTRQVRTTKHYTCSGPETRTSWSENSGMIPAGQRPDRYTTSQRIIATCIFRPEARTFECHGGSNDGSCGLTSAGYGATGSSSYSGDVGSSSLSRCLTGEKWTGTYRGSIY